jgi:hypothetical protein
MSAVSGTVDTVTLVGLVLGLLTGFDLFFKSTLACCGVHFSTKPKCTNCKGEHPSKSNTCTQKNEKKLVMKKVLVEKCTPQQARVDLKNKSKPVNKPKSKPTKVTVSTVPHL